MPAEEDLESRYRSLKDRDLRGEGVFICEGRNLVLRLLESDWEAESVLCAPRFAGQIREAAAGRCPVIEKEEGELSGITGFPFHRGVLACGVRRPIPPVSDLSHHVPDARTVVVLPDLANQENIGGIIRSAHAFGVDAVVLGGSCGDPFGRKALKTSMGSTLRVPLYSLTGPGALKALEVAGFTIAGMVTAQAAVLLQEFRKPAKTAVLIGGEAAGLSEEWQEACDILVTIPMNAGIDSLNAAVAAGIVLYTIRDRV